MNLRVVYAYERIPEKMLRVEKKLACYPNQKSILSRAGEQKI
jgi:hypothetical protein